MSIKNNLNLYNLIAIIRKVIDKIYKIRMRWKDIKKILNIRKAISIMMKSKLMNSNIILNLVIILMKII